MYLWLLCHPKKAFCHEMFLNQTRAFHFPSKSHIMQSRQAMAQRMLAL